MKSKFYLPLIAMAIGMIGCTNDLVEEVSPIMGQRDVIAVSVDNADTRTAMAGYNVVWSEDDAIGIFVGSTNNEYELISDAGTTSGDFQSKGLVVASAETLKEAAYFPYVQGATWDSSTKTITTSLPATYEYAANTNNNAVMAALMAEDAQSSISFQNAGALYAITVENIPAEYDKAVMTYLDNEDNVGIAGAATITFVDGVPTLAVPDADNAIKTITISFGEAGEKTFYFPMPVKASGYASKLQFSLQGEGKEAIKAPVFTQEPVRSNLYAVTLKLDAVSGGIVSEANDIEAANAALANDAVTSVAVKDVSGTEPITIPAKSESADVPHTIDLSEAELPTGDNKLTINVDNTTDNTTVKELTVVVPDEETAGNLVINAPGTTVTIQSANGTVIETIEATTAENTLIIGEGVTIKKLVVKGGNVVLKGNVESIESEVATTITLDKDITLEKSLVFKGENITLAMAGKTITSSGDGIEVVGGTLTITGDGTVNAASGDQWVAVWANGGNVVIENGTYSVGADANGYTNDCIYAKGSAITINGGTFTSEGTYNPPVGGMVVNANNTVANSKVTINGGTFNLIGDGRFYEDGDYTANRVVFGDAAIYTMNVTSDMSISSALKVNAGTATLAMAGKTITSSGDGIEVVGGTLNITGDGTVNAASGDQWVAVWANGGNVVIENGTYSVGADANGYTNDCIYAKGSAITINGGTFSNEGTYDSSKGGVVINAHNTLANSKVTINGGTFNPATGCVAYEDGDVTAGRVIPAKN